LSFPVSAAAADDPVVPVPVTPGVPGNGRAWELVTPPDPVSAQIVAPLAISVDGDELFYFSLGPMPNAPSGYPLILSSLARRTADGWVTTPIGHPDAEAEPEFGAFGPDAFGPNLAELIWTNALAAGQPEKGIFRRGVDGSFELLSPAGSGNPFKGASVDLTHVVFTSAEHLLPGDAGRTEGDSVYEVVGSSVRLVDVDSGGSLLSNCGSTVPQGNRISRDGRRIFFMTRPSCSGPLRAFMREDGATTRLISGSACTLADCGPEADVTIVGATPSGSRAFLVTEQKLTNEDDDAQADLYRYDAADGGLTLLSANSGEIAVRAGSVVTSADGSRVLFRAGDAKDSEDKRLYMATAAGPRLVAAVAQPFVQLSDDGRYALFVTGEPLAAADGDESLDVYRYDAASDASTLISDGPGGGDGAFDATDIENNQFQVASHPYRAMSDDGGDVFFNTSERLLPQDRNDFSDVYEWYGGDLDLVSAGSGDRPAIYVGATPDGNTAFFRTTSTLLPRDRDGGDVDFYAARLGGGFPEPSPPAVCGEEACLPPLGGPVGRKSPATMAVGGFRVRLPRAAALRRSAARGWIRLLVEVPAGGRLTARARTRIGGGPRGVAHLSRRVAEAGTLNLRMRLSPAARRALARGDRLRIRLVARLDPAAIARTVSFELGGRR
jgi:hypothetical protein